MATRLAARVRGQRPEHWAGLLPEEPAVVDGDSVLRYGDWNQRADRLADGLARRRVSPGIAAVALPPCADWFVISLALAKLGWRHVAAAPDLDPAELRRLFADTGAAVLFADGPPGDQPPAAGAGVLTVSRRPAPGGLGLAELIAEGGEADRYSVADAPLVLYTSGTTGARKGVARGVTGTTPADQERIRLLREYQRDVADAQPARLRNRTLATLPMHHGTGPGFAQRALSMAGTVYLLPAFDPRAALRLMDTERITHWAATPWLLHQLRSLPREVLASYDVSSMETINVGSAAVPPALKLWVGAYFGEGRLREFYGATEVGVVASMPPAQQHRKPGSCGRPHRHVEVRIVDSAGRPVAPGTEGELLVRTPQAAAGYVGDDPPDYALDPDGYFRIGDIGRADDEGYLYLSGRTSDVITQAGRRVHAGRIEEALAEHPAVLDAAVIGWPGGAVDQQVIAFCEIVPGSGATGADLSAALAGQDPAQPAVAVQVVGALPRNDIGKVVKQPLREQAAAVAAAAPARTTGAGGRPAAAARASAEPDRWYSRDGLDRAWRAVHLESESDQIPAPEKYIDLALNWDSCRESLLERLRGGQYRPRPARLAAIPKGLLTHRPLPVLEPVDRVVLMALVQAIAPTLLAHLGPEASGLSPDDDDPSVAGGQGWLDFERAARKLARGHDPAWGIVTDVASFGESVDLGLLAADLRTVGVEPGLVTELTDLLRQLGDGAGFRGLPHNQSWAALLGGFYLRTGDAVLRRLGISFVRMQDDILMFDSSPARLSRAFAALERELRSRRLILSTAKTALRPAAAIVSQFVPRGRSPREAFDAAMAAPGDTFTREVRFALARLAAMADGYAADWVLDRLPDFPALAAEACGYLRALVPGRPDIGHRLGGLADAARSADPFVMLHVLRALGPAAGLPPAARELCWDLLRDGEAEFYVRQEAARCVGRHGGPADAAELARILDGLGDADVARAVQAARSRIDLHGCG
jgi:long-chain acyl-CoA synthetase